MRLIADLHIHSKYSRSCSKSLTLENIGLWCQYKGINVVGTADFTHPAWFKDIKNSLEESEPGLFKLKNSNIDTRFILSTEISCIYTQGGKVRRVHVCILVPKIESVEQIINNFQKRGFNLKSDGRPIIGLSAKELARLVLEIEPMSLIVPAHIWTPWYSVFGSKSGFDSLDECFEDVTPNIFAIETGLSSDPLMNWNVSLLDNITLLSNSDAHSLNNLGREVNVFSIEEKKLSYYEIYRIIKEKDKKNFLYTVEFFPQEGKYYADGHLSCKYFANPRESKKNKNICPVCLKPLTLGVLNRINNLTDRKIIPEKIKIPYKSLIPLQEIISEVLLVGKNSKKVLSIYFDAVKKSSEFEILIDLNEKELLQIFNKEIVTAILNVRNGKVIVNPGYDGIYGTVKIAKNSKKS